MSRYKNLLILLSIILLSSFAGGCGGVSLETAIEPTIPNQQYSGRLSSVFNAFADKNPLLANELAKLPAFQNGVSEEEMATLETLMRVYDDNPDAFDRAFAQMYKVGIPEVRKYCSPLEAAYWIAQKNADSLKALIKKYNTEVFLANGWEFYDQAKWKNSGDVIDRLNAPELVQFWFLNNFTYAWRKFWIRTSSAGPQSAATTLRTKKGICFDAAYLAYVCLKRAGYDATGLNVYFGTRTRERAIMHSVCIFKSNENGKIVYYKLADTSYRGHIEGPFSTIKAIAENVAFRAGVSVGTYITGKPAYHYSLNPGN
jgi:hypothetical protein